MSGTESFKGRLLISAPALTDPNFDRTIVLLLEHEAEDGALGLVLNRPSETPVGDVLERWQDAVASPPVVFVGGPVERRAVIALARHGDDEVPESWQPVLDGLGVIDVGEDPALVTPRVTGVRIFSGYAGWAPGQLEGEIEAGAWFVVDAEPDDAVCDDPDDLWRRVLERQPGELRLLATYPPDPSLN